ncbi:MAG: O-antigen biosynthesis protein WbqP [Desulforhopalus sp.]|jgi:O-antigen biosynthesis protein WbqP
MKRYFDIIIALIVLFLLSIPMLVISILIKITSKGPVIYWSHRVGRNNVIFHMPKYRTMVVNTPVVATHLLKDSSLFVTPLGRVLRKTSIDEIPQLISILRGQMSFVGPRPALYNQDDLISLRTEKGVHVMPPGLTGLAQINGRDSLPVAKKVEYDVYYLQHKSMLMDVKIIGLTFLRIFHNEDIHH